MSVEAVHIMGSTTYFIFALLFLWVRTIPRSLPGAGWWASAIAFALVSRLILYFYLPGQNDAFATFVYVAFNIVEKPLLLIGMVRFLGLNMRLTAFWLAGLVAEAWLLTAVTLDFPPILRTLGYSCINALLLFGMSWLAISRSSGYPVVPMRLAAVSSFVLALHWVSSAVLINLYPVWFRYAFVLGTGLTMLMYFSLLAAFLVLVQKRLIDAEAHALDLAFLDPLTGLNNKRYMNTLFDQALLLATRPHHVVAVFYIDLDNFKPINDTAGHAVGDEVLKMVAARLKENTRSTDICARIGGDEFVVIGTQLLDDAQALEIGNKILGKLLAPVEIDGKAYKLGASIGIALFPRHGKTLADLMKNADSAMYEVKRNGKNRCEVFGSAELEATSWMRVKH